MKLDLSSRDWCWSPDLTEDRELESLSLRPLELREASLEDGGGSGFPICEQVWARRANGLFLASSYKRKKKTRHHEHMFVLCAFFFFFIFRKSKTEQML